MRTLKVFAIVLISCGFWPVWRWYISRTFDASDEPWGLLSIAAIIFLYFLESKEASSTQSVRAYRFYSAALILSLLFYIVSLIYLPHLIQALLMVLSLFFLLSMSFRMPSKLGVLGLFLLALPVLPSLNFFVSYPLRMFITAASRQLLNLASIPVVQDGTMLMLGAKLVSVDAPCSGVNMLWSSAFLACLCMCLRRLNLISSTMLSFAALILILFANVLRVSALTIFSFQSAVMPESIVKEEPIIHLLTGLSVFVLVALGIAFLSGYLQNLEKKSAPKLKDPDNVIPRIMAKSNAGSNKVLLLSMLLSALAAIVPLCLKEPAGTALEAEPRWPLKINGAEVRVLESNETRDKFAESFPGKIKVFSDGSRKYIMRWIHTESRQLHPSSDCYKGMGFSIEHGPLVSILGNRYSSFIAVKNGRKYRILERIYDEHGSSWTEPSEWYWAATLDKTSGPWWDLVVIENLK
ncbi:MAG: exosortase/archaeosortase family protein [Candidatus Obscuribacterales bacterium]|nr:exosortase/archaeosortase family protein [Candidatus Obscuribacterales bacterium]